MRPVSYASATSAAQVAAVDFAQDVADVGLGGHGADHEAAGDLGVAQAAGDQAQDLALALGQLGMQPACLGTAASDARQRVAAGRLAR
jgi:hypothetical protein